VKHGARSGILQHPSSPFMLEATRLADDGELGNSDAMRLLHLPHGPEDLEAVLASFEHRLTAQARSKLTLAARVPLPQAVANQRWEPIFDRYPISGRLYRTASGAIVLDEVQYYNGRMVQVYGECSNVAAVREMLAGTGYKPLTVRHAVHETAVAQFWAHRLSDTSLRPYDAAFLIVAAVPECACATQACMEADAAGAVSALSMLDGSFEPAVARYVNRVSLYYVRLLDSTQVAIDVGRERMGTDKRAGTVMLGQDGGRLRFTVRDGRGEGVATIAFTPPARGEGWLSELARSAFGARIAFQELPPGTEYVYPSLSRIGSGPLCRWEWRTDLVPTLQPASAGEILFDARSEEGAMLKHWGFAPKAIGYIPNVRGVITGIQGAPPVRRMKLRVEALAPD